MSTSNDRVYIGLPERLAEDVFWVGRTYRTNSLSHIEGGSDIIVEHQNGSVYGYDWIKQPSAYITAIFAKLAHQKTQTFKQLPNDEQMAIARSEVSTIHARQYEDEADYNRAAFSQAWDASHSDDLPWEALRAFDVQDKPSPSPNRSSLKNGKRRGGTSSASNFTPDDDLPF